MKRAFTLIELLVVIAIIAILAAILFPVFARAKEAAKKTQCLSNAKQLGLGLYGYVADFDDTLPMGGWIYGEAGSRWYRDVYPYMRNVGVFVCPSKTDGEGYYVPKLTHWNGTLAPQSSGNYGIDVNLVGFPYSVDGPPAVQTGRASKTLTEIPDSAGTFLVSEAGAFFNTIIGNYDAASWTRSERRSTDWQVTPPTDFTGGSTGRYATDDVNELRRPAARHNGGLNAIFCDGHAKWSRIEAFLGPLSATRFGWPRGDARNSWDDQ